MSIRLRFIAEKIYKIIFATTAKSINGINLKIFCETASAPDGSEVGASVGASVGALVGGAVG